MLIYIKNSVNRKKKMQLFGANQNIYPNIKFKITNM